MFVVQARSLDKNGAPKRCFIRVGSGLTRKNKTSLEKLAMDKPSSSLQKLINCGIKSYITFGLACIPVS